MFLMRHVIKSTSCPSPGEAQRSRTKIQSRDNYSEFKRLYWHPNNRSQNPLSALLFWAAALRKRHPKRVLSRF